MNAYSMDLRERVLGAVRGGMPRARVAETFGVSLSTVKRYVRLEREGAGIAPKPSPGRTPAIAAGDHEALREQLRRSDTATLAQHAAMWARERGVGLSIWAMARAIKRIGWTRKKGRWAPRSGMSAPGPSGG